MTLTLPNPKLTWLASPPMPPMHPIAETVAASVDICEKPPKAARL